jgi:DNA polymerase III sliding clamp (beta) subunit (PCNA family)
MAINWDKLRGNMNSSGGSSNFKSKINFDKMRSNLGIDKKKTVPQEITTEDPNINPLDKKFFDKSAQDNYNSLIKLGLTPEQAMNGAKSSYGQITPMKTIKMPKTGGTAKAESYYGKEGMKSERKEFSQDEYESFAQRDDIKRKNIFGILKTELDHLAPISIGGTNEPSNLKTTKADTGILGLKKPFIKSSKLPDEERQGGLLVFEKKVIDAYQNGELNQWQALELLDKQKSIRDNKPSSKDIWSRAINLAGKEVKNNIPKVLSGAEKGYDKATEYAGKAGSYIIGAMAAASNFVLGGTLEYARTGDKKQALEYAKNSSKDAYNFGASIGEGGTTLFPKALKTTVKVIGNVPAVVSGKEEKFLDYVADEFINQYHSAEQFTGKKATPISKDQARNYLTTGNFEGDVNKTDKSEIAKAWYASLLNTGLDMYAIASLATANLSSKASKNPEFKVKKFGVVDFENGVKTTITKETGVQTSKIPKIPGKGQIQAIEAEPSFKTKLGMPIQDIGKKLRIAKSGEALPSGEVPKIESPITPGTDIVPKNIDWNIVRSTNGITPTPSVSPSVASSAIAGATQTAKMNKVSSETKKTSVIPKTSDIEPLINVAKESESLSEYTNKAIQIMKENPEIETAINNLGVEMMKENPEADFTLALASVYRKIKSESATKKYDRTLNLQDEDDVEYLKRIFGNDSVEDMKNGIYKYGSKEDKAYIEKIANRNIIDEPISEKPIKTTPVKLDSYNIYHGTSADVLPIIKKEGFKFGSELPEDAFRSGGYGRLQDSISFSMNPKIASRFTGTSNTGGLLEAKINSDANIVKIDGIEYAEELNDIIPKLLKDGVDAVYIGGGEEELVVINPKVISLTGKEETFKVIDGISKDIWNKNAEIKEWQDIQELDAQIRKIESPDKNKKNDMWSIDIGLTESLGENGDIITRFYNNKPTIEEIKNDIIEEYKSIKKEINKPMAGGVVAKSGRDENIEKAIDNVLNNIKTSDKKIQKEIVKKTIKESSKTIKESKEVAEKITKSRVSSAISSKKSIKKTTPKKPKKDLSIPEIVKKMSPKNKTLPILNEFLVKDGKLITTDLEVGLSLKTDMKDGIYKTIGNDILPGEYPAEDFPELPEIKESKVYSINSEEMSDIFKKASSFIDSKDYARPEITGVSMQTSDGMLTLVGTDSYRLFMKKIPIKSNIESNIIIHNPKKVSQLLGTIGDKIDLSFNDDLIKLSGDKGDIIVKRIIGTYPDFKQIIPKYTTGYSFDKSEMTKALKDLAPYYKDTPTKQVQVELSDNNIKLSVSKGEIEKSINVKAKKTNVNTKPEVVNDGSLIMQIKQEEGLFYNANYLLDALNTIDADKASMYFAEEDFRPLFMSEDLKLNTDKASTKSPSGGSRHASYDQFSDIAINSKTGDIPNKITNIQMPEMLKLANELLATAGNSKVFLRKYARSFGMFYGEKGDPRIGLNPSIFRNPNQVAKTLAHEVGHLIDYLPDKVMKGKLISKLLVIRDIRKGILGAEEDIANRKKVLSRIRRYEKLQDRGELTDKQTEKYNQALSEYDEINNRLIFEKDFRKELEDLSFWYRPLPETGASPSHMAYRKSSPELYADFISVLFNNPEILPERTPLFYDKFFKYLDRKPEVKKKYFDLMDFLTGQTDNILEARGQDIDQMFKDGEALHRAKAEIAKNQRKSLWYHIQYAFYDKNIELLKKEKELINRKEKAGIVMNPEDKVSYMLEENNFLGNEVKAILEKFNPIRETYLSKGLTDEDMGKMLFLKRVLGDRSGLANPLGQNPETAQAQLDYMRKQIGLEKYSVLERAVDEFQKIYKEEVLEPARDLIKEDTYNKIMNEESVYGTYATLKHILDGYVSSSILHQVGTLDTIANPLTSTLIKAIVMRKAARLNETRRFVANWLVENFPDDVQKAKVNYKTGYVKDIPFKSVLKYKVAGKPYAYYVDPYIEKSLSNQTTEFNEVFRKTIGVLNRYYFKPVYITFNVGFQSFNLLRDFSRTWKANPDLTLAKTLKKYVSALPEAKKRALGKYSELISEMENNKAIGLTYNDIISGSDGDELNQVEQMLNRYGLIDKKKLVNKFIKPLAYLLHQIKVVGDVIETLPKVATYTHLKEQGMNIKEISHIVRSRVGTPDFTRKGNLFDMYNNVFLFSNIFKEGYRADIETAFVDPRTRSGYWWKTVKKDIVPKLIMALMAAGLFGKEIKELIDNISEYDKTNYTTLPLGKYNGKTVYMRIPSDETGRLLSGIFWKIASGMMTKEKQRFTETLSDVFSFAGGQIPSFSPSIGMIVQWNNFLNGRPPRDTFRGYDIVSDTEMKAGGWYKTEPMLKWTFNQLGLSRIDVRDKIKDLNRFEKSISMTPILGRFFKISNRGLSESLSEKTSEQEKEEARISLKKKNALIKYTNKFVDDKDADIEEIFKELAIDVYGDQENVKDEKILDLEKDFVKSVLKTKNDPYINSLIYATTNKQKGEIILDMKNNLPEEEFKNYIIMLLSTKIIGETAIEEAIKKDTK